LLEYNIDYKGDNDIMNKPIIVAAITLLILAGGVGAYFLINKDKYTESVSQAETGSNSDNKGVKTEQASIEELLTRNASLKCNYKVNDAGSENVGFVYFSGGKDMHGEFTNTEKGTGKSATVFVIISADTQYIWTKDSDVGYKADVSDSGKDKQQQMSQQFDPDKKYEFSCVNWQKDESKFTPPSSVTFTDISAQIQQFKNISQ
jgi:hypothetical protein